MDGCQIPGPPNTQAPYSLPPNKDIRVNGVMNVQADKSLLRAQQEVDILNRCFEEIEAFMAKLQQVAEAQIVLEQRNKKKKSRQEDDLLSAKAKSPPEEEFIHVFQKFKYSFCLLARLKSVIANPTAEEILHHIFKPLEMMVNTTGGPALASSVMNPALTEGAVRLLKENLTQPEHMMWSSLGSYWTQPRSALNVSGSSYSPVFMNGWKPPGSENNGWIDPIQLEHRKETEQEKQESSFQPVVPPVAVQNTESETDGAPLKDRLYRCSYGFVARNSSELSVLQGETIEVIESSKRWWKCRNRYNEIGFVPFNILEPLSHIESPSSTKSHKDPALPSTMQKNRNSLPLPLTLGLPSDHIRSQTRSIILPPQHLPEDTEKVMQVNDELLQRLTNGKAALSRPLVIPRSSDTSLPLDYHSPSAEVEAWLRGKGFSESTVQCLRVLNGAQLFSLNKEELRAVVPEEGARVYSQLTVQKALLEDVRRATELEAVMEKQKMKVDLKDESGTL